MKQQPFEWSKFWTLLLIVLGTVAGIILLVALLVLAASWLGPGAIIVGLVVLFLLSLVVTFTVILPRLSRMQRRPPDDDAARPDD